MIIDNFFEFFSQTLGWGEYSLQRWFLFFISVFFSILFLQSGLDKIISFSANLNYFKDHFKNTFFKNQVKFLLIIITFLECLTGILFLIALFLNIFGFVVLDVLNYYFVAIFFALITLSSLFLGQRLVQDYAGAVSLAIYFLIALIGLSLPVLCLMLEW